MKAAARRPGSHGAGRQARATAQRAGRAAPGLPLLPTGPGPALPASVGPVPTRGDQAPPAGASPEQLWTPQATGAPAALPGHRPSRSVAGTPLPPQLLAPSPSPTPQGQRAAPEDHRACGHWLWPQVKSQLRSPSGPPAGLG